MKAQFAVLFALIVSTNAALADVSPGEACNWMSNHAATVCTQEKAEYSQVVNEEIASGHPNYARVTQALGVVGSCESKFFIDCQKALGQIPSN
jgi:hypothetical protein